MKIFRFLVVPALLIGIGWQANNLITPRFSTTKERLVRLHGFKFISPLTDVELPEGYDVRRQPIPFKGKIANYAEQQIASGQVRELSVYFRDLSEGPWFGINENVKYNPASMMKLPIMLAWLKRAEKDPAVLESRLTFDEKMYAGPPQGIKPAKTLEAGVRYTVEDLLRYMMYYSDNRALWLLHRSVTPEEYDFILDNMDVANEKDSEGQDVITVHTYSGFLRILYNASFLSREMSEKALQLMSFQDFPKGIAAGLPEGTRLASKFGEFSDSKNPGVLQLHEFGIVYHPKGPYILGILTRGYNMEKQAAIIKTVSKMVYESVDTQINNKGAL
ncbi:MAG: serine hydrolase [Nitrospirae bacterium]|nr:serine hydrolase [Nitrospirota bacterium]